MTYSVVVDCPEEGADDVLAALLDFDTSGVEQSESQLTAHFGTRAEAMRFAAAMEGRQARLVEVETRDWAREWQQHWRPSLLGTRFYLSPPWVTGPAPEGRITLEMRPGLVFGGGDHPTTQLCVELLEEYARPGALVVDVGCGSGILSDAAGKLGAGRVVACDIEFAAAEAARAALPEGFVFQGSVEAIRPGVADVVVANLLTGIVVALLPVLAGALKPGGALIVSGFLAGQAAVVDGRAQRYLSPLERRVSGDWAAASYRVSN
jgi:ribosomal protein L11 methyltransferase